MSKSKIGNYQQQKKLVSEQAREIQMIVFDFDGVFTDNRVLVLQDGSEGVFCNRADGLGIEAVRNLGIKLLVLSTEKNPVVSARCKKLDLTCIQGCNDKLAVLKQEARKSGIALKNIAFMGNDVNDLDCLRVVGFPACVADAHPDVLSEAKYITRAKGGQGAVREFCDFIAAVKTGKIK